MCVIFAVVLCTLIIYLYPFTKKFFCYTVLTMYNDRCTTTVNGKSYTRILLRRSVRVGKKVTHPVVAHLSDCPPQDIAALELALRHRHMLAAGAGRGRRLALWQVIARTLEHSSRLSAVRLAEPHAACAVLQTAPFTEDHLYANLAWLAGEQVHIE